MAEYPTPYWMEIMRIMSTQKAATSESINTLGEKVEMWRCNTPTVKAADIYSMLNHKPMPFRIIKFAEHSKANQKCKPLINKKNKRET